MDEVDSGFRIDSPSLCFSLRSLYFHSASDTFSNRTTLVSMFCSCCNLTLKRCRKQISTCCAWRMMTGTRTWIFRALTLRQSSQMWAWINLCFVSRLVPFLVASIIVIVCSGGCLHMALFGYFLRGSDFLSIMDFFQLFNTLQNLHLSGRLRIIASAMSRIQPVGQFLTMEYSEFPQIIVQKYSRELT